MSSREAFEAWVTNEGKFPFVAERSGDSYKFLSTQNKWEVWQAATNGMEARCAALTAENAALKSKAAELVHEASEVYSAYNSTITEPDGDFMDMQTLQEMQCVETPATAAFLAEVRAQGVEMYAENLTRKAIASGENKNHAYAYLAANFAAQLRQVGAV